MVPTRIVSTWWMAYSKHLEEMLGKTVYNLIANLKQRIALFNVVFNAWKNCECEKRLVTRKVQR